MITTWAVHNIKCGGCARTIRRRLSAMTGVSAVQVDVEHGLITFDADVLRWPEISETLAQLGYVRKEDNLNSSTMAAARSVVSCLLGRVQSENA
jgi:copper chaperone